MNPTFRAPFRRFLAFGVRTGILLLIVFGVVRVALVLQANVTGNYQFVSIVFVAMAVLPWIVLTREGAGGSGSYARPAGAGCCRRPSPWRPPASRSMRP